MPGEAHSLSLAACSWNGNPTPCVPHGSQSRLSSSCSGGSCLATKSRVREKCRSATPRLLVWCSRDSSRCDALAGKEEGKRRPRGSWVEPTFVFDLPKGPSPARLADQTCTQDEPTPATLDQGESSRESLGEAPPGGSSVRRETTLVPSSASGTRAEAVNGGGEARREGRRGGQTLTLSTPPERNTAPGALGNEPLKAPPDHKSGYVALVGQPNAGKSTLLNALIGQKLSIVTRKPQTTRHRILGLCSGPKHQIVLYDTPGVIPNVMHKLDDCMMQAVRSATINADVIVLVVDATLPPQPLEQLVQAGSTALSAVRRKPCAVVLNKKDALKPGEVRQKLKWYAEEVERLQLGRGRAGGNSSRGGTLADPGSEREGVLLLPVSARHGHGVQDLVQWLLSQMPYGPAYYPKDVVSELPERFFVAEIVREHLLLQYREEVPYACQVLVRSFKERPSCKDFIALDIVVEKESQKGILLGKGGLALKALASSARLAIEEFLGREAFLEVKVKVQDNWREDEQLLKRYGLDAHTRGDWY